MPEESNIQTVVERRRSERAPVTVRVEYETVDAMFSEFTQNINEGGLFIETECPLGLDEQVVLHFRLPGSLDPVKVTGRVAWVGNSEEHDSPGMGIEFEGLSPEARRQINDLVLRLRVDRNR